MLGWARPARVRASDCSCASGPFLRTTLGQCTLVTENTGDSRGVRPTHESSSCRHAHAQVRLPLLRFQRPATRSSTRCCNSHTTDSAEVRCAGLQAAVMVMHTLAGQANNLCCSIGKSRRDTQHIHPTHPIHQGANSPSQGWESLPFPATS